MKQLKHKLEKKKNQKRNEKSHKTCMEASYCHDMMYQL